MSSFSVAPSVEFTERDATLYTASNVVVNNALVGKFHWGPINDGVDLDGGEKELIRVFGKPTDKLYNDYLVAIDYLNYSRALTVIRTEGPGATNAVTDSYGQPVIVENENMFDSNPDLVKPGSHFMARYAGELGNNLMVSVADSSTFRGWEFETSFEYEPESGEYSIVVVDTNGSISGFNGAYGAQVEFSLSGTALVDSELEYHGYGVIAYTSGSTAEEVLQAQAAALPTKAAAKVSHSVDGSPQREALLVTATNEPDPTITNSTGSDFGIGYHIDGSPTGAEVTLSDGESKTLSDLLEELVESINSTVEGASAGVSLSGSEYKITWLRSENKELDVATIEFTGDQTVLTSEATLGSVEIDQAAVVDQYKLSYTELPGITPEIFVVDDGTNSGLEIVSQSIRSQGSSGDVIESYNLMKIEDGAKKPDGSDANVASVINDGSNWIYFVGDELVSGNYPLTGGVSDSENASRIDGYNLLSNAERYKMKGVIDSAQKVGETQKAIDVCVSRRDAVAIWAPTLNTILNNPGSEKEAIVSYFENLARATSYQFGVDNWGYIYDRYNQKYRWIPCTGGVAGKRALNMQRNGSWVSFSYYNRGKFSNYRKLAWSAGKEERKGLYKSTVNSIIHEPGEGFVLMGTKTGLTRPSSFSRINVRDFFIMIEQDISSTAKYFLGELNDPYTRSLFRTTVDPYLRNLKDRGAMIDYRLRADETNNDAQVIAENQMVAGIFIKPSSVIDWIWLDFAALRADMEFSEVENLGIAA